MYDIYLAEEIDQRKSAESSSRVITESFCLGFISAAILWNNNQPSSSLSSVVVGQLTLSPRSHYAHTNGQSFHQLTWLARWADVRRPIAIVPHSNQSTDAPLGPVQSQHATQCKEPVKPENVIGCYWFRCVSGNFLDRWWRS